MILINFLHSPTPTPVKTAQTVALIGMAVTRVITLPTQFDNEQPYLSHLQALIAQVPIAAE